MVIVIVSIFCNPGCGSDSFYKKFAWAKTPFLFNWLLFC